MNKIIELIEEKIGELESNTSSFVESSSRLSEDARHQIYCVEEAIGLLERAIELINEADGILENE